jgi:predicted oxidoreductase
MVTKCDIVAPIGKHSGARVKHYDTSRPISPASRGALAERHGDDRIDLLLIHRPDPLMDHEETGRALDALVASGKVRAVGVSNFRPWDWSLLQSAMETPLVTNQIELSAMHLAPSPTAISRSTRSAGTRSWRGRRSPVGGCSPRRARRCARC